MIHTLKSTVNFGKHKGETVEEIIKDDPNWLAWACDEIEWFDIDQDAIDALDLALWEDETFDIAYHQYLKD